MCYIVLRSGGGLSFCTFAHHCCKTANKYQWKRKDNQDICWASLFKSTWRFIWQWTALKCCIQYEFSSIMIESFFFLLFWAYYSSKMSTLYCFYYWCCRKKLISFWSYSQQEEKLIVKWICKQACIYILESLDQEANWRSEKLLI